MANLFLDMVLTGRFNMIRSNNRQVTRLFFILVLAMAFFGGRYAYDNWRPELADLEVPALTTEGDWVEFVSAVGEEMLQLFLGLTSDG
ncbi:MAG: hypothetical protein HC802_20260 [Caldilineaceae bacterium]|nr:hypothetical protein [Caldilineaceae bacterium]